MPSEKRSHPRHAVDRPVQLRWVDPSGRHHQTAARLVDLGRRGARVESPLRPPLFGVVEIVEKSIPLRGKATVRYVATEFTGPIRVGLEFCGGLLTPREFLDQLAAEAPDPQTSENIFA